MLVQLALPPSDRRSTTAGKSTSSCGMPAEFWARLRSRGNDPAIRRTSPSFALMRATMLQPRTCNGPEGRGRRKNGLPNRSNPPRAIASLAFLAWMTLSLGTSGFVCGLSLMAWSMNTGRQELWTIGTPIIFAGQIALVMGLVLQLDRVWRDSRWSATKMETVDEQLHDLKMATTLLNTAHGPSSAFYAHWAGGAGPEILLGDLKSQLDLLAIKLSKP